MLLGGMGWSSVLAISGPEGRCCIGDWAGVDEYRDGKGR
jgi:hypothetical protein